MECSCQPSRGRLWSGARDILERASQAITCTPVVLTPTTGSSDVRSAADANVERAAPLWSACPLHAATRSSNAVSRTVPHFRCPAEAHGLGDLATAPGERPRSDREKLVVRARAGLLADPGVGRGAGVLDVEVLAAVLGEEHRVPAACIDDTEPLVVASIARPLDGRRIVRGAHVVHIHAFAGVTGEDVDVACARREEIELLIVVRSPGEGGTVIAPLQALRPAARAPQHGVAPRGVPAHAQGRRDRFRRADRGRVRSEPGGNLGSLLERVKSGTCRAPPSHQTMRYEEPVVKAVACWSPSTSGRICSASARLRSRVRDDRVLRRAREDRGHGIAGVQRSPLAPASRWAARGTPGRAGR